MERVTERKTDAANRRDAMKIAMRNGKGMKTGLTTRWAARVGLGAAVSLSFLGVFAGFSREATAQAKQTCHMKESWNGGPYNTEFDVAYTYNRGEDDFNGVYINPTGPRAEVSGSARGGVWNILFNYVDPASKGVTKRLVGRGALDPATHNLVVSGTFQHFKPGASAPDDRGTFSLSGVCK